MEDDSVINQIFKLSFDDKGSLFTYLHKVEDEPHFDWSFFSKNMAGGESMIIELLTLFDNFIDFNALSSNIKIRWTENLIYEFEDKLNWRTLSLNSNLVLTHNLIERYQDKWFWGNDYGSRKYTYYNKNSFSSNPSFPMDPFIIEKFKSRIDWRGLGLNPSLKVYYPIWEYSEEDAWEKVERCIYILNQFKGYWKYERSRFVDDNAVITGNERTSLFDNNSIDWNVEELRELFELEISNFNKLYNESI